ncbi:MAG: FAD-binding oxidoreductase [Pseudomonadota bacterium]
MKISDDGLTGGATQFAAAIERIKDIVGPLGWVDDTDAVAPYLREQRGLYQGNTLLVVRPASTQEVSETVQACAQAGIKVIPQGGNTGLCGAGVPPADGRNIVLSMSRMRRVREVDADNFSITVEAGCVLAEIQQEADRHDRLFPLSLGAEGSCQIGGNLSTNAGGLQVLRYGNARDLTLGLEVVLADGRILNILRALRKDNTGYDLKQLFIGAEGTLGIITAATLKLYPKPRAIATAIVALPSVDAVIALLALARSETADQLTAFEMIPRFGVAIAVRNVAGVTEPFTQLYPWYVLMEVSTSAPKGNLDEVLETLLSEGVERGLIIDAAIAMNQRQRSAFWKIREGMVEAQRAEGPSMKYDISVPVTSIARFIEAASSAALAMLPDVRPFAFGHCGDGNVHFNLSAPASGEHTAFLALAKQFDKTVFDIVHAFGGSISAEHGIGLTKREMMGIYKTPTELEVMQRIKAALDPAMLFNPDKVLPAKVSGYGHFIEAADDA